MLHALSPKFNPGQLQNGDVDIFLYGMNETQARHPRERGAHHSVLWQAASHPIPALCTSLTRDPSLPSPAGSRQDRSALRAGGEHARLHGKQV